MFKNGAVNLIILILLGSMVIYLSMKKVKETFPGDYPMIVSTPKAVFSDDGGSVRIDIDGNTKSGRIIVYAYDKERKYFGMIKPIVEGAVRVNSGDLADFEVDVQGNEVKSSVFLKKVDRYVKEVGMLSLVRDSMASGRRFGVQACLYPLCSRCLDGCRSVIHGGDLPIVMSVQESGEIKAVFSKGKCPRCGKCFTWCPSGVIQRQKNPWEK